ncbi:hypothetical protein IB265_32830 [Ensifer sp. ENS10]|uniref:hypothetical protein n=1 Tax=Ensifer sp. ENS10 TaxID=2769286 RepID=UPI00177BD16E|nr:hypothetical protein [Ensifer sp. ENS10]MBD9511543.1 hypothetical protein [Ensifer sp. ENS10]
MIRELKFTNSDATPKTVILKVETEAVAPIMSWYGGYHSGDRYTVHVDCVKVEKDQNGELLGAI